MAMPRKLKNLMLFNDANIYRGVVKSVTLPALGRKMEAYRGAGMNGPVKADLGFSDDGIQFEWKTGGLDLISLKQFGMVSASGVALRFTGAYEQDDTGEVSAAMIREAGAEYVIVGHSERRTLFGETDSTVNRKAIAAFGAGLTPIVCIGETLDQRERGETFDVLDRQIKVGLDGLTTEQLGLLVLAYEPVWAIGTGRNATPAQAAEAHGHIRQRLRQWFSAEAATQCHVIYGGSVKPDNIHDLITQSDVDGALVGGASLDIRGFFEIVSRSRSAAV